jgi:hypothetical protein
MSELFSVLSGLAMLAFVAVYMWQTVLGVSTPNPGTWIIWSVVMAMNTASYYLITGENLWPLLTPVVINIGLLLILAYSCRAGKLGRVGATEIVVLLLAGVVGVFWTVTKNPVISNLMIQVVLTVSFIPTVFGLLRGELREASLSWDCAVLSYGFLLASVLCSSNWSWAQLAYPFFNGVLGNGSVAIATRIRKPSARFNPVAPRTCSRRTRLQ